jgi:pimeloyl-ACP methyl ester carboxylesterase
MWNLFWVLLFCFAIAPPAHAQIQPGVVTAHPADVTIPYDWFSYVPGTVSKSSLSYIWVTAEGGNVDYNANSTAVRSMIEANVQMAESNRFVLLFASIPRVDEIYAVAFDKQTFAGTTDPFSQRPDLKVNQMIDKLLSELGQAGYNPHPKVFVEGYSNGGMFAQRYSLLHPERAQAVAGGQCGGFLTFPESAYNTTVMDWAIGINDVDALTGSAFNQDAFKNVPHFIYIGDQDNNNSHFLHPNPEGFWSQDQIDFINNIFGDSDPVRLENQCNYLVNAGYDFEFKVYPNVGHVITNQMRIDVILFFDQFRESPDGGGSGGISCFVDTVRF